MPRSTPLRKHSLSRGEERYRGSTSGGIRASRDITVILPVDAGRGNCTRRVLYPLFFAGGGDSAVPHAAIQANSRSGKGAEEVEEGEGGDECRKYVYSVTGERNSPVPWRRYCTRAFIAVR